MADFNSEVVIAITGTAISKLKQKTSKNNFNFIKISLVKNKSVPLELLNGSKGTF